MAFLTPRPGAKVACLAASGLALLAFLGLPTACKPPRGDGRAESFIENGQVWAWGRVQLTHIDAPASLKVEKVENATPDQSVDNEQATYRLYGAIEARTGGRGLRDLAYVDYHRTDNRLLAYAYNLEWRHDAYRRNVVHFYAVLRKPGRTYPNHHKLYLGEAEFVQDAKVASVRLANGVQLSAIADGVFAGQWALHYAKVKHVVVQGYVTQCPRVSQMPGQNPNQNPNQIKVCRPIPAQVDLCNGDPTKEGCRPMPPSQAPAPRGRVVPQAQGLKVVAGETSVFTLEAGVKEAKVIFVSSKDAKDADAVREECGSRFFAVARTVGGQINDACRLKAAPTDPVDGKLACAVTVSFDNPQTYMDRVCNVTASFRALDETQEIQILKN